MAHVSLMTLRSRTRCEIKVPKCIVQLRHLLDTTVVFYPIFDPSYIYRCGGQSNISSFFYPIFDPSYIYRCGGQIQYILGQNFCYNISSSLSLIKMQTVSIFLYILCYDVIHDALKHACWYWFVFYQL